MKNALSRSEWNLTWAARLRVAAVRAAAVRLLCLRLPCLLIAGAITAGGCAQLVTSMLVNTAPELLAITLGQFSARKEFEEAAPLIKARDWLGLSTLARQKLAAQPTRGEWWQLAGYGHMQSGEYAIARDCFERLTQLLPEEINGWNLYANMLKQTGEPRAALIALEKAMQVDPTSTTTLVILGDLHAAHRRPVEAVRAYDRALELDSQDIFAWYGLGLLAKRGNDTATLERVTKHLKPLYPPFADELARK